MSTTRRRAAITVPLVLAGLALSGCGVAQEQIRPGTAADVDGAGIDSSYVDDTVDGACDYLDAQAGGGAIPRAALRRLVVETLVREKAAEQLVDELGAELSDTYPEALAGIEQDYTDAPDEQAEAMRVGDRSNTYVAYAADAIGNTLLREETGREPGVAQEIRDRGNEAIAQWLADNDVDLNPTYGLRLDEGAFVADDGLSVPGSTGAVFAQGLSDIDLGSEDQEAVNQAILEAVAQLPPDQVCGTPAA